MARRLSEADRREKLGTVIGNELARAEGAEGDELQSNRAEALRYYFARPRGDELVGRSAVISTDVADMVNACLAMVVPMISTDALVEFGPNGLEDEPLAKMETDALNSLVMEDNQGFIEVQEAVQDAFLLRNGCLKVWSEDETEIQKLQLPDGLPREQLAALLEPRGAGEARKLEGSTLTVRTTSRRFRVGAVPIENISYQAGYQGDLQKIRFFAEYLEYTRSDLVELGAPRDLAYELQATSGAGRPLARMQRDATAQGADAGDGETRDQDVIDCHEVYLLVDLDDDGISERYRCLVANEDKVLSYQPADLLPYALGSPFLRPHRITGESLFDHLRKTQDTKTQLMRQLLDNVTAINNGRYAYDPSQVSEEDVLRPRAGGGIRARNPAGSVVPIAIPDVTSGILAALNYEDRRRTERGGASLELMGAEAQVGTETAWGTERQFAAREALASMMAINLSKTLIRGAWTILHEFLRRYSQGPLMVHQSGQYIQTDPRSWPRRTRLNVTPGLTPGQRGHIEQALAMHQQVQLAAIQAGGLGTVVDLPTVHRTAVERLRMAGVPNPERHVLDPSSPAAQQAAAAAAQKAQSEAQAQQQFLERGMRVEERKVEVTRVNKVDEVKFDYRKLAVETETGEAELAGKGVIDLERERMKGETARAEGERQERVARSTAGTGPAGG